MTDIATLVADDLARSGLSADDAAACSWNVTDDAKTDVHHGIRAGTQGLVIPYYDLDGAPMLGRDGLPFMRLKVFGDPEPAKGFVKANKGAKYIQGPGTGVHAYFPPFVPWREVIDARKPIVITEGEKKAAALCTYGIPCIGLGGVYNFVEDNSFLPELQEFPWPELRAYLCFDSDAMQNEHIKEAERRLLRELSTLRGADVRLIRIPEPPPTIDASGKKVQGKAGIDDYLLAHGIEAFFKLMDSAQEMSRTDRDVLALNDRLVWIGDEDKALEVDTQTRYTRASLISGSKFASMKYTKVSESKKGGGRAVTVRIPQEWLEHELKRGYDTTVFLPKNDAPVLFDDLGRSMLNVWSGYREQQGDVSIFLDLTKFIFSELPPDLQDFPLKLMAFKAQNPHLKVPIALMFVGQEGTGKSAWATAVAAAFAPYSQVFNARVLGSDYNGFIENTLIAGINELNGDIAKSVAPTLRTLISDEQQSMNEKYRAAKQVRSYTMFLLTANDHGAASFGHDDRRFFIIPTPVKLQTEEFYGRVFGWLNHTGNIAGKAIMHYLLNYELNGWRPPVKAPGTQEKAAARDEGYDFVGQLAADMLKSDINVVKSWMLAAIDWANERATSNPDRYTRAEHLRALDILAHFPRMSIRPWYTAQELLMLFPYLADHVLHYRGSGHKSMTPGLLSRLMRNAGIPLVRNKSPGGQEGFLMNNKRQQFLLVSGQQRYAGGLTDEEFDVEMKRFSLLKDHGAKS